jgi:Mg/Co/Ni transporter MgtE
MKEHLKNLKMKWDVWSLHYREYLVGFIIGVVVGAIIF